MQPRQARLRKKKHACKPPSKPAGSKHREIANRKAQDLSVRHSVQVVANPPYLVAVLSFKHKLQLLIIAAQYFSIATFLWVVFFEREVQSTNIFMCCLFQDACIVVSSGIAVE